MDTELTLLRDTPPWDWPGDAGRTFRKFLNSRKADAADRLIAAELAGDYTVIDNDLANVLLTVLRNREEPEDLRAAAAASFGAVLEGADTEFDEESGEFDDPEMVPISLGQFRSIRDTLQQLYADESIPKLVRRRILEASVRAPEPWHAEAIGKAYASGDHDWVLTAVFCMQYIKGFDKEILDALENPDPEIHYEAVRAAGEKELDAAWAHVSKLAQDESTPKDLRIAAIVAAGQIRPREAQEFLFELTDSTDEDIAEAADEALSFIGEEDDEEDEEDEFEDEDEDEDFEDEEDEEEDEEEGLF
jgi:uncharacterized protein (UPF0147 family)